MLGQLARAFHYRDRNVFVRLYVQYVRPHLEFSTQAWSPWCEADKAVLEKVQQKAVMMVSGLDSRVYEERLRELGLQTLEERRHQADMHMVHKILHGVGGLDQGTWFQRAAASDRATRSNADPYNVKLSNGRLELRRNSFGVRVTGHWNNIPADLKLTEQPAQFKRGYSKIRNNMLPVA